MILQSLCEYYDRKQKNPKTALAAFGFEVKPIPFVIVLDEEGRFVLLADEREDNNGKLTARPFMLPKARGRSGAKSYETVNCLWDHYGYLLAQAKLDKPDAIPSEKDLTLANNQHNSFRHLVKILVNELPNDVGVNAVWRFLNLAEEIEKVKQSESWQDVLKIKGCNLSFRLVSETALVCQSEKMIDWVKRQPLDKKDVQQGFCLVTGEETQVVRLHGQVAGVNQKPAPLAAINDDAYNSFNKSKGFNFPVSVEADFKYTTSLNYLLRKNSKTKFRIGDTSYVCWSEKGNVLAETFSRLFVDTTDDPDRGAEAVKALFATLHNGAYTEPDGNERFYVLGLSPNSARIAIRFWQVGTIAQFSERLGQWFSDLSIVGEDHHGLPTLKGLLRSLALLGDEKNLPANLASDISRAVLSDLPLPAIVIHSALRRIRAEPGGAKYPRDDFYRVSLIKAYLIQKNRSDKSNIKEITMSLNVESESIGYQLGRLFSVLEKLQKDAQGGINSTIRDRYYNSASCTPISVFGTLIRLHVHHLKKLENPAWKVAAEKRISEIINRIDRYPDQLVLEEQGQFSIGYYHQKQDLYTKKTEQGE
ncbi:type I-C CRISPR-associated protein Cas8c/Csd1 [bacterium AH-315-K03]|nr:type I-C CRISPR-associated protein Cas8c/Csd1 [bacterium AH-315-K03]